MIHSNEIKDMGGLRKIMPLTHICFLIACLAIAGIPPFSGFFSKEEILLAAFHKNKMIFATGLITSGLTAFYMFRLYFLIFWRKTCHATPHSEGTISMKMPLLILSVFAIISGFVPFGRFISADGANLDSTVHLIFSIGPVAIALFGLSAAAALYKKENDRAARIAGFLGNFYKSAYDKFYVDEFYIFITKKIMYNLIGRPAAWFDKHIVDGLMNGLASVTSFFSELIKRFQSGRIQLYALYFFGGVGALVLIFIYLWK
jgi:NADH-quinone oxidoreductase subunit L